MAPPSEGQIAANQGPGMYMSINVRFTFKFSLLYEVGADLSY